MLSELIFTRENLDNCLKNLAKEYRKHGGKNIPAELILIGGASILVNYGFRNMTYDIDAIIRASSAMKDAINHVGDKMGLPNGWLNSDFMQTTSYSPKLIQHSTYYKTFFNVLTVRTISGEYLIAMKLMSGRQYKNDISDVVGILYEHRKRSCPILFEQIDTAVCSLYGGWSAMPENAQVLINHILDSDNLEKLYQLHQSEERSSKLALIKFEEDYPAVLHENNLEDILQNLKKHKKKPKN